LSFYKLKNRTEGTSLHWTNIIQRRQIVKSEGTNQPGGEQASRRKSQRVKKPGVKLIKGRNGNGAKKPDTMLKIF